MNIIKIIEKKFPKNGWAFNRTRRIEPMGYLGYMITIFDVKDDTSIIHDIKGKSLHSILSKLNKIITHE